MITHLGHIAILVTDLERSLDFYCNKLGLKEGFRLKNDKGETWLVYVLIDEHNSIELFPGANEKGERIQKTSGFNHICLLVDDINKTLAEIGKRGVDVRGEPKKGDDGNWQYWVEDPDGNAIEFMQIMPDSLQAQAARRLFK